MFGSTQRRNSTRVPFCALTAPHCPHEWRYLDYSLFTLMSPWGGLPRVDTQTSPLFAFMVVAGGFLEIPDLDE